jgi:hypothetical protein
MLSPVSFVIGVAEKVDSNELEFQVFFSSTWRNDAAGEIWDT